MIEKKSMLNAIKRALQSGAFNMVGQELTTFPIQLCRIDSLNFEDQNWWECNPIIKIDLSNNTIANIPANEIIDKLPDIQLIRMKNNIVKQIPDDLFMIQNLKSLDLSGNKLEKIRASLSNSAALVEINFANNQISEFPEEALVNLKNLQLLYMQNNKLKSMPTLGVGLKKVDFSQNQITVIERRRFERCRNMEFINLNKNQIKEIERGAFRELCSLVSIEIKENRIVGLFEEMPKSDKLDNVVLSFNRITNLAEGFFENSPNLTVLILSDNKIDKLTSKVIALKKLKTLDLSNNDLSDLPSELGLLPALVRIQLEGNPLKCIRQNIRTAGAEALKKYLRQRIDTTAVEALEKNVIDPRHQMNSGLSKWDKLIMQFTTGNELVMRGQGLDDLDSKVFKKNIKVLNLANNKLTRISGEISNMTDLKVLNLNENLLEDMPMEILGMQSLEQLELKKNRFSQLFHDRKESRLDNLFFLELSLNRFTNVPVFVSGLRRLRIFHFSYNKLSSMDSLCNNPYLNPQVLDLSNNQLTEVPESVADLNDTLNFLNVENNNIQKLPTILGFMKLTGLKVDGNPLKLIKRTVIEKGTVALIEDLKNKHVGPPPKILGRGISKAPKKMQMEEPVMNPNTNRPPTSSSRQLQAPMEIESEEGLNTSKKLSPQEKQQITLKIQELNIKVGEIEREIENNMSMNRIMKAEKKKQAQALLIQRNKLLMLLG